jgi:4-amino-4-deoxy-L-arabinose transferase-like glycosyltransferase
MIEETANADQQHSQDRYRATLLYRILWACALGVAFLLQVRAAFRGGYVGPDYDRHLQRMLSSSNLFDFSTSNPPIYLMLGHLLFRLIGRNVAFPITLAIIQAAVNALAMWWFFLFSEPRFKSRLVHLALVFFLTFLPVRVIHSTTAGDDWMTIPVFVLLLYAFDKFLSDTPSGVKNAAILGLTLAFGIWSKYSFVALLPALLTIFVFLWWERSWKLKRFVAICVLSLGLPSALGLVTFWASGQWKQASGRTVRFLPPGGAPGQPDMSWKDLFSVKAKDLELFKAPEYFRIPEHRAPQYLSEDIRAAHKHSYLGLSHLATFTDTMNLFQELPGSHSIDRILIPDFKIRERWKTPVMQASMSLGTIWTVLALVSTPWMFFVALKHLLRDKLQREDFATLFGVAYFLLMFLPIPFVYSGALGGAWTPRYILVPLLCFFWAAFLLLDRTLVARWPISAVAVFALVAIQSGIEIVILA